MSTKHDDDDGDDVCFQSGANPRRSLSKLTQLAAIAETAFAETAMAEVINSATAVNYEKVVTLAVTQ